MIRRLQKLSKNNSFFLFGARGTGKSTLLEQEFSRQDALWIDLLLDEDEDRFGRHPDELLLILAKRKFKRVIIDEIQKAPKLLDLVHHSMEKYRQVQFILTGSSARKLKRGGANLLAGRAFLYHLFPLTFLELREKFDLKETLQFGSLPKILSLETTADKNDFLRSYIKVYLKEEILVEQIVRQLNPFRGFLEVAAQTNGQIINHSKIARDISVDDKTVANYFTILVDTLIGFYLQPFHRSIRKRQKEAPKFYLFDTGVKRALDNSLRVELMPKTYAFGRAFEHWVIAECHRLNEYGRLDFRFSYLTTKDGAEIDLIIERPGEPELLVEVKSKDRISRDDVKILDRFANDWDRPCQAQVWSLDPIEKEIGSVECLPWEQALERCFTT